MSGSHQTAAIVAKVSQREGDLIADMVLQLVTELAKPHRRYPARNSLESTGTGYLPIDVKEFVLKASAA